MIRALIIFHWTLVVTLAFIGAILLSNTPDEPVKGDLLVTVSYVTERVGVPVTITFRDQNDELEFGMLSSRAVGHNTTTFQFSDQTTIDSLAIQFGGLSNVKISCI